MKYKQTRRVEPRPRLYWQKQSKQPENKTIDRQDEAEQREEEDQIQSDEHNERQGKLLEDME